MVAGVDLDLVAGEVAQVGDDGGLLGVHRHLDLGALEAVQVLVVGHLRAPQRAGRRGEEGLRTVERHRAPLPGEAGGAETDRNGKRVPGKSENHQSFL